MLGTYVSRLQREKFLGEKNNNEKWPPKKLLHFLNLKILPLDVLTHEKK